MNKSIQVKICNVAYTVFYDDNSMKDYWMGYIAGVWNSTKDVNQMLEKLLSNDKIQAFKDNYDLVIDEKESEGK